MGNTGVQQATGVKWGMFSSSVGRAVLERDSMWLHTDRNVFHATELDTEITVIMVIFRSSLCILTVRVIAGHNVCNVH